MEDIDHKPVDEQDTGKVGADNEAGKAEEERRRSADSASTDRADKAAEDGDVEEKPTEPMTAVEAKVAVPSLPEDMPASDHFAQKFGNDPANPKPAPGAELHETDEDGKIVEKDGVEGVKLYRVTPDHAEPVYTTCSEPMVGDFLRAGWNRL